MSHHFNAEFTVIPPGKEAVSKKLRSNESLSAKRKEAKKLDVDNKQMEWRLEQLKLAMTKEKEDREKQGFHWKSGVIGSHSRKVLGRTVSAGVNDVSRKSPHPPSLQSKSAKTKKKVHVLKDEPLDIPKRRSHTKGLIEKLKKDPTQERSLEAVNDVSTARALSINKEEWISIGIDRGVEDVMDLQSDQNGNLPLSSIKAINPEAVGLYFLKWGRKRLLMAVDDIIRRPKGGWDADVYYPYVAKISPQASIKPEPPSRKSVSPAKIGKENFYVEEQQGGLLLEGSYDEAANARSFKQAVSEWRGHGSGDRLQNGNTYSRDEHNVEMSVHAVQANPPKPDIKFSEVSTLSYMEKVLLDKHRKAEVPALKGTGNLIKDLNHILNGNEDEYYAKKDENENLLTEEELLEKEEIRQLFSPSTTPRNNTNVSNPSSSNVTITEVEDDNNLYSVEEVTDCIVEEAPVIKPNTKQNSSSVKICEVFQDNEEMVSHELGTVESSSSQENSFVNQNGNIEETDKTVTLQPVILSHTHYTNKELYSKPTVNPLQKNLKSNTVYSSGEFLHSQLHRTVSDVAHEDDLVRQISQVPINPDMQYRRGLTDFFVWTEQGNSNKEFKVENEKITSNKITKSNGVWNQFESNVDSLDYYNHSLASSGTSSSSSMRSEIIPMDINSTRNNTQDSTTNQMKERSDSNSSNEDDRAINQLEWELASQTGNLTADGRISRLIDEWSEDDDLGIIEDTGAGSGLSTPDIDQNSLPHSALPKLDMDAMQHDFQQMEQVMLEDICGDYSDNEF